MTNLPDSLQSHRVAAADVEAVCRGRVRWAPRKSLWFLAMLCGAVIGGALTFSWPALALYVASTAAVLLFGHSLGNHRKLVHDAFECSNCSSTCWCIAVFTSVLRVRSASSRSTICGLRATAAALPRLPAARTQAVDRRLGADQQRPCPRGGGGMDTPPMIRIERRIDVDRFYVFLECTWMAQHLPGYRARWARGCSFGAGVYALASPCACSVTGSSVISRTTMAMSSARFVGPWCKVATCASCRADDGRELAERS